MRTYLLLKGTKQGYEVSITLEKVTWPTCTTQVGNIFKEKYILNTECFCIFTLFMS